MVNVEVINANPVAVATQTTDPVRINAAMQILASADKNYIHNQTQAAAIWTIEHNLRKFCSITVVDSAGSVIVGDIDYIDDRTVKVMFSAPFSGKAYCN